MALEKILKNSSGVPTGEYETVAGGCLYADAPLATIFPLMSSNIPTGYLLCDGTAYRKADYPELWELLPSTVKDTTNNTFTIDLREATLKGAGLTGETVGAHLDADGLQLGEFIDDRVQAHSHNLPYNAIAYAYAAGTSEGYGSVGAYKFNNTNANNGRSGATTEVKSRGVNFIIKAKMIGVPADFLAKVDEAVVDKLSWKLLVDLPRETTSSTVQVTIPDDINEMLVEMYTVDSEDKRQVFGTFITQTVKNTGDNPILQFYAYDNVATTYRRQANCNLGNVAGKYSFWMDTSGNLSVKVYYR